MIAWLKRLEAWSKLSLAALCLGIVIAVGFVDYLTGYETFFFVFYLIAVFISVWFVNLSFGVLISAFSVVAWVSTNYLAGIHYSSNFVPVWNAIIMFAFYLVVVGLLARLRTLHSELEERVRQRTVALTEEIRVRTRLQKELLETSEREQRRISHDLHDGLCQHLTGTALVSHVLGQKLAEKSLPETTEANRIVELVEEAIELTRTLARGLHPVEIQTGRLADNFQDLAARTSNQFKVACQFECHQAVPLLDVKIATQLFRITQEAVVNAARHGKPSHINICFDTTENETILTITDDGCGLPENARNGDGMGLRIMAYRAETIGATFQIERLSYMSGTRVTCTLSATTAPIENYAAKN
jgi:signal transduction histidine kinase